MCRVLKVSPSGYYDWLGRAPSKRQLDTERLRVEIAAIHRESRGTYGSPRVHAELVERGVDIGRHRVAHLMAEMGLVGHAPRRYRKTTDSNHDLAVADNLVAQDFVADRPNQLWASDITYVWTEQGWIYLAVVIDLFSRMVVGWACANHMRTELVLEALGRALGVRDVGDELVHHSDRGSQYASRRYRQLLEERGITCSMSAKGCCFDNAPVESFFASLKKELIYRFTWPDRASVTRAIAEYIGAFYNRRRRHSTLGYLSPADYEKQHQQQAAVAA
jgi:transposase InsO family protein